MSRGPHRDDAVDFGDEALPKLQTAAREVGWLLDRGYSNKAVGTLVGDHHQLTARQRRAVMRCACGAEAAAHRAARELEAASLSGQVVHVDGFNLLLTIEAAIGGAVLLLGQDGCMRDMASTNGRFVGAAETPRALAEIGAWLAAAGPKEVRWLFDRPVPHSGRIAAEVERVGRESGWPWRAETVLNPDPVLKRLDDPVITADGAIMDEVRWVNTAAELVARRFPKAWVVRLDEAL